VSAARSESLLDPTKYRRRLRDLVAIVGEDSYEVDHVFCDLDSLELDVEERQWIDALLESELGESVGCSAFLRVD